MHHTRFSRRSSWVVITLFSLSFMASPALAQNEASKKKMEQRETDSENGEKPERKKKSATKKTAAKTEKEKKPQLQLLGSKVTYSAPRRWAQPQISTRPKLEALQFTIPLPVAGTAARNTSAIVIAEPNTDKLSLADFSNSKIPRKYPAGTIVGDQTDGDSWRTVVSYVHEANPPYTVLDRFGVAGGLRVHFRIIFPQEDDTKATWPRTLAQESNEFVRNLRMNDKNKVTADLFYDAGKWGMREAKAGKKTAAKEPARDTPKAKQAIQKAKAPPVKKTTVKSSPKVGEEFSP